MTEKRFVVEKYSVRDMSIDEKYVNSSYHIGDKGIAQSLCDLLNEQHETIKEVHDLLVEEVDLFSDKATEHDINAYVELKEFDNKDAYYMATATKKAIKMLRELI